MIIIEKNNNEYIQLTISFFQDYLNSTNIEEIKEITIINENIRDIHTINFYNYDNKLKINYCNLSHLPTNIPTDIQYLDLSYNIIATVNLSNFHRLITLKLSHNSLVYLNIPTQLQKLECQYNNLSQFNITPELKYLDISNNLLVNRVNSNHNQIIIDNHNIYLSDDINVFGTNDIFNNNHNVIMTHYFPLFTNPIYMEINHDNNDNNDNINNNHEFNSYFIEIIENDPLEKVELKNNYYQLIDKILQQKIEIPEDFICPITKNIFYNPVTLSDGHTYEKYEIIEWIKRHDNSPLTNEELEYKEIYPNYTLKKIIREWIDKNV